MASPNVSGQKAGPSEEQFTSICDQVKILTAKAKESDDRYDELAKRLSEEEEEAKRLRTAVKTYEPALAASERTITNQIERIQQMSEEIEQCNTGRENFRQIADKEKAYNENLRQLNTEVLNQVNTLRAKVSELEGSIQGMNRGTKHLMGVAFRNTILESENSRLAQELEASRQCITNTSQHQEQMAGELSTKFNFASMARDEAAQKDDTEQSRLDEELAMAEKELDDELAKSSESSELSSTYESDDADDDATNNDNTAAAIPSPPRPQLSTAGPSTNFEIIATNRYPYLPFPLRRRRWSKAGPSTIINLPPVRPAIRRRRLVVSAGVQVVESDLAPNANGFGFFLFAALAVMLLAAIKGLISERWMWAAANETSRAALIAMRNEYWMVPATAKWVFLVENALGIDRTMLG